MDVTADPLSRLRERTSMKWRTYPADVLPLFVAELDYPLAEPIADALVDAVRRSDTGYVAPSTAMGAAFSSFADRRWGWRVDPGQVAITSDVGVAIVETLRRVIRPGDAVVINPPVYPPFFELVEEAGGRATEVPLRISGDDRGLDLEGLERAFQSGARAYLLCNPHNPLGLPHPAADLRAVSRLAERYGVTVVSDEVHAPLTHPDAVFTPYLAASPEAREHGICVTAASKAWNLAGLKCAVMVTAGERLRQVVAGMPDEVHYRTGQFGLIAGVAAFTQGEPWLGSVVASLAGNRRLLGELLRAHLPEVAYTQPSAGYLAWLDFRPLGWGDDPAEVALERARVALNPGPAFGRPGVGHARLNFGCSAEVLAEAVTRLAEAR